MDFDGYRASCLNPPLGRGLTWLVFRDSIRQERVNCVGRLRALLWAALGIWGEITLVLSGIAELEPLRQFIDEDRTPATADRLHPVP
jgi:hypothetical protein